MLQTLHDFVGFILNFSLLEQYGWRLLDGLRITALVVSFSVVIGFFLGYLVCQARLSKNPLVAGLALFYTSFFRGTPLLCLLYLVYYGGGEIRPFLSQLGLWWFFRDSYYCCIFTCAINTSAYQAEILRGALASVPKGQREAAASLGLSTYRIARHVVWPQAFLVALRPLGNELISMIKASALAAIVTLLDLFGETRFIFARTFDFSVYLYAALIYLCVVEIIRRVWNVMERALSRHLLASDPRIRKPEAGKQKLEIGTRNEEAAESTPSVS